jgi:dihydrofolate reductase
LNCDLFIIGGAETYKNFADVIEKWIVTEVTETVKEADAFMPEDFLNDFKLRETKNPADDLKVKF